MVLKLHKQNGAILSLDNEALPLSYYGVQKYDSIKVISDGENGLNLSSFAYVPKYEISREEYLKRPDNAATWMAQNIPKQECDAKTQKEDPIDYPEINVGDRVMVLKSESQISHSEKRHLATVSFTDHVHFQEPHSDRGHKWIGIVYDKSNLGKHNGTVDNVCYFTCLPNQGSFVRRKNCFPQFALADDELESF
ncbi:hypothetical protein MDAP_002460 [Mitosporidium daphniae]